MLEMLAQAQASRELFPAFVLDPSGKIEGIPEPSDANQMLLAQIVGLKEMARLLTADTHAAVREREAAESQMAAMSVHITTLGADRDDWKRRAEAAERMLVPVEPPGDHEYHGPTTSEPHPTLEGQVVKRAVQDETHERFHKAVGDVIAGKVMPAAREQMRRELDRAPPDAPITASTSRPMPGKAITFSQQEVGLRLPVTTFSAAGHDFVAGRCGCGRLWVDISNTPREWIGQNGIQHDSDSELSEYQWGVIRDRAKEEDERIALAMAPVGISAGG